MKLKLQILFVLIISLVASIHSQNKPQPTLFDTYNEETKENTVLLATKIEKFAARLKTLPSVRAAIVYFPELPGKKCVDDVREKAKARAEAIEKTLIEKYKISVDRISLTTSSFRQDFEVEFWLAPKDSYAAGGSGYIIDCFCPQFTIDGSEIKDDRTQTFLVNMSGGNPDDISYQWKISTGKILSGQNTSTIEVDLNNVTDKEITTQVEIDGCCMSDCVKIASRTTLIKQLKPQPILVDKYVDENRDLIKLDAMIDKFARRLNQEPSATRGYIIKNVPEPHSKKGAYEIANRISENINRIYHFPTDRIVYEFGGISRDKCGNFADYTIIEFWLVPEEASNPETTPEDADMFYVCECPTLSIEGEELAFAAKQPLFFTAELRGDGGENASFKWTISDGTIVSGQGTNKITLDLSKAKHGNVTVKVEIEIGSICASCPKTEAEKTITVN